MPGDNYSDAPDSPVSSPSSQPEDQDDSHSDGQTAVVPKSICPDMNEGDEMVLKIVKVEDDSYVVAYAPKEDKKEPEGGMDDGGESAEAPPPSGGMSSMMG